MKLLTSYDSAKYDLVLGNIYQALSQQKTTKIADKIDLISQRFLGKPYLDGALGEGPEGQFDQSPLYRTDLFDCLTFVNTTLALAISSDLTEFRRHLLRINYYDGEPRYEKRFHFMSVDWNPQNAKWGLLHDITQTINDEQGDPIFAMASAEINRPNWFRHRTLADIKLLKAISAAEAERLLLKLKNCAQQVRAEEGRLPYLPLDKLLINGEPDQNLLTQIPSGSVVEIVRPAWDLRASIGTYLNVSHLGFVLRIKDDLIFRHASSLDKHVVDIPLVEYLRKIGLPNATIKGINIQTVNYP